MSETDAVSRRLCEATTDYPTIKEAQTMIKETANPIPPTLAQACRHRQPKAATTQWTHGRAVARAAQAGQTSATATSGDGATEEALTRG